MTEPRQDETDDADVRSMSAGEHMVGWLLDVSHELPPDDIADAVRTAGAMVGLQDVQLYLIDLDQRVLVGLDLTGEAREAPELDVGGTVAGLAFRRTAVQVVEPADAGGHPVGWWPLLDGSARVGVMSASLDGSDERTLSRGRSLASLAADLIVAKKAFGDNLVRTARVRPVSVSAELRWAFLPPLTFQCPHAAIAGFLQPAYDVAGDAFDYNLDGDTLHFAIFDALGHGLAASRLANLALVSYRHSRRVGLDLQAMYRTMDAVVTHEFGSECFVTAQLATLDLAGGRLRWINAGHPRPLLLRDGTNVNQLEGTTCVPLGLGQADAEVGETTLQPGDGLLFFSDGVVEARSPGGEEFGVERLGDFLVRAASDGETVSETVRRLAHAVADHQSAPLKDDATLVLVTWHGR